MKKTFMLVFMLRQKYLIRIVLLNDYYFLS